MSLVLPNTLGDLEEAQKLMEIQKSILVNSALNSQDPHEILKAQNYINSIEKNKQSQVKAFTLSPEGEFYNGLGYKNSHSSLSYDLIRSMARSPIIRSIVTTRLEQVLSFSSFSEDTQKVGWTIKKRTKIFQDKDVKITDKDKSEIERIATFILNGGSTSVNWLGDDFESFLRKVTKDSLELDQMCFEIVRDRKGSINEYLAVDGGTIRFADTYGEKDNNPSNYKEINGYLPSHVQIWRSQVMNDFYPWEMCMGMRNISTSVISNGYSTSELEDLVQIVTYLLYGINYNGLFFKQGSNPKGILTMEGNVDDGNLNEFRQHWRSTVSGINNAHKLPVLSGTKVNWLNMQQTNKDMEFSQWNDFLMTIACSVFRIDPSELGYNLSKAQNMFGQDGQKERLDHSKKKGLVPLLKFIQNKLNKFLVYPITQEYEFAFTGIEVEDQASILEADTKKSSSGFVSLEDMFRKYSGRDFDPKKDTLLNSAYLQIKQMNQMGGDYSQSNPVEDGQPEEENPFMKGFRSYLEKSYDSKQMIN